MRWVGLSPRRFGVPAACVAAVALAGCSTNSSNNTAVIVKGNTLTIYATQPPGPRTAVDTDVLDAEKLALQQAGSKSGKFTLRLKVLHDSTVSAERPHGDLRQHGDRVSGRDPAGDVRRIGADHQPARAAADLADRHGHLSDRADRRPCPDRRTHWYPDHGNFGLTFTRMVPNSAKEAHAVVAKMKTLAADEALRRV